VPSGVAAARDEGRIMLLIISHSDFLRGLCAMMLSICLSVRLFVCLSPVKFVKSLARWQHQAASGSLSYIVSRPIHLLNFISRHRHGWF